MTFQQTSLGFVIRIHQGEEIIEVLTAFCKDHGITGAFFYGLGAVREATLGMYHMDAKEYQFREFTEPHEIANLSGNVALKDGEHMVHAHATLADAEQEAFGGHVKQAIAEPTCEITLFETGTLERAHDETSELPLLDLPESR